MQSNAPPLAHLLCPVSCFREELMQLSDSMLYSPENTEPMTQAQAGRAVSEYVNMLHREAHPTTMPLVGKLPILVHLPSLAGLAHLYTAYEHSDALDFGWRMVDGKLMFKLAKTKALVTAVELNPDPKAVLSQLHIKLQTEYARNNALFAAAFAADDATKHDWHIGRMLLVMVAEALCEAQRLISANNPHRKSRS